MLTGWTFLTSPGLLPFNIIRSPVSASVAHNEWILFGFGIWDSWSRKREAGSWQPEGIVAFLLFPCKIMKAPRVEQECSSMRPTSFRRGRSLSASFRSGLAIVLVWALTFAALSAQTPQPRTPEAPAPQKPTAAPPKAATTATLPSARTIIDRHIEAIGGRKAVLGHNSTHASGTMSMAASGVSGVVEVYAAKPNRSLVKLKLGGIGEDLEYYDVETRFRIATVATRESPMGPMKVTLSYGDYKKFGDVMVPTTMTQSTMGVQQVLTFTSVEFDKVPPSTFEPPAAIKALIK